MTVRFDYVADTLDNAMTWARPDFLLFNGTNLFLYPEGSGFDFPATRHDQHRGGLADRHRNDAGGTAHVRIASNYHDLVDMPFFVGQFDVDSAQIADHWVRFATYPSRQRHRRSARSPSGKR